MPIYDADKALGFGELGTSRIRSEYEDSHFEGLSELALERPGVGVGLGDDGVQRQRQRNCLGRGDLTVRRCFLTGFQSGLCKSLAWSGE